MKRTRKLRRVGIGALATLSTLASAAAAAASSTASVTATSVDTSSWKCESCPFEKAGASASVDIGVGVASNRSARYADETGIERRSWGLLGGDARWRGMDGWYGSASARDLGLDSRSLALDGGREGVVSVRLGWDETPRHLGDGTSTPFLGVGSGVLTLPAGFPAASTAAMPLAASLQAVDVGYRRNRLEFAGVWNAGEAWSLRLGARHDTREGSWPGAGSFFANTSQLVVPVDHTTDQLEVAARYSSARLQLALSWQASVFRNRHDALTWQNPFTPIVAGADGATLALAPDNQFHQLMLSAGWAASPALRVSGEVAAGRMTQDAAFLPLTSNAGLLGAPLPAASLQAHASTLDANLRVHASLDDRWRFMASASRNERRNDTAPLTFAEVSTDMFAAPSATSQPYSFTQDRMRLQLDRRGGGNGFGALNVTVGGDLDDTDRTNQDTPRTREARAWVRVSAPLFGMGSWSAKAAHAERSASAYTPVTVVVPAENPLLRRFNLADRRRDNVSGRADIAVSETVSAGVDGEWTADAYRNSEVGLRDAHTGSLGGDLAVMVSDQTSVHGYLRGEQLRSRMAGSQRVGLADWRAKATDRVEMLGLGLRHSAMKGRLDIAADLVTSRARSQMVVDPGSATPAFPAAGTARDSLTLSATYKLQEKASIIAGYGYERRDVHDWRLDGVLPSSVANLLALGQTAGSYDIHQLTLVLRYRF